MDTRGTLFFEIQRILVHRRPKVFLLENVKQLRGHDKGNTLASILSILRGENTAEIPLNVPLSEDVRESLGNKLNYEVDYRVLKAINFGVPQNRERIYIVGFDRDYFGDVDLTVVLSKIFSKLESETSETRLGDILDDNSTVDQKYTISDRLLAGHERRRKEHKLKGNGFGYSVFNKESPYCNTISARYYKDGSEILIDQSDIGKNPRKLTPRECARIQGFPETFCVDSVSDAQIYKQFGNSVSVPVVREIAKLVLETLKSTA
jgi:DNA (cytosine-5)-methyltransferase 1